MKEKILRGVAIATVSLISAALVTYLKKPENMAYLQKSAKKYQIKFKKAAKKTQKAINKKVKEYRV